MDIKELIQQKIAELETTFCLYANDKNGLSMSKYMKDRFYFFGIKSAERKKIQQAWIAQLPKEIDFKTRWEIILELYEKEEREFHYVAIDWLNSWHKKLISTDDCEQLKWLISNHSWWDSVDSIASNYLGKYCEKFPEQAKLLIGEWRYSDNLWLNRSCIIFQLKYREKVDFELLKSLIIQYQNRKEFFIQKAIGWSLRQYSKFNPEKVSKFVHEINLQGLAKKEASKYL
jgi:3-methyladenine DNA glycosylase AlkD